MRRAGVPNRASARTALRAFDPAASSNANLRAQELVPDVEEIGDMLHVRIYVTRLKVNCLLRWKLYWSRQRFLRSRANMIRPISGNFSSLAAWKILDAWREHALQERNCVLERLSGVSNLSLKRTFLVIVAKSASEGQRYSPSDCSNLLTALLHWYAHNVRPRFRALLAYSILTKVVLHKVAVWALRLTAFRTLRFWSLKSSNSKRPLAARACRNIQMSRAFNCLKQERSHALTLLVKCNDHLLSAANKMMLRCARHWLDNTRTSKSLSLRAANMGLHKCRLWAFLEWKVHVGALVGYKRMFIRQCRVSAVKCFKRWYSQSSAKRIHQRSADRAHDLYRFRSLKRSLFVWRRFAKCAMLCDLKLRMSRRQFMLSSFQHFRNRLIAEKAFAVVETLAAKRGNTAIMLHTTIQWQKSIKWRRFLRQEFVRMNCSRRATSMRAHFINFKFLVVLKRRSVRNVNGMGSSTISQWRKFLDFRHDRRLEILRLMRYLLGLKAMHLGLRASRLPLSDLDPAMWPPVADYLRANAVRQHMGVPKQIHAVVCSSHARVNSSYQQCLRFQLRLNAIRVFNIMRVRVQSLRQLSKQMHLAAHHAFSTLLHKFLNCWKQSCQSRGNFRRGCVRLHYILLSRHFKRFVDGVKIMRLLEVERRSAWLACTYTRITRALHKWNDFTRAAITMDVRTGRLLNKLSLRSMGVCLRIWMSFTARSLQFRSVARVLGRVVASHRLRSAMHSWIETCASSKLVAVHMSDLGRYKKLIKSWIGWGSLAVANRAHRVQISQADMFFRSWAFRRSVLKFKAVSLQLRNAGQKLDAMVKRRHKKILRRTLSALRTRLYMFRVKSLRYERALLHWKRARFYQWISNTRVLVSTKQDHASAKSHFRQKKLVRVLKSWFFFVCKLRRAQAFAALLSRYFKYFAFTSAFKLWRHHYQKHQSRTASFGQVITTRRFKLCQSHFQLWAVATAQSVRLQSAVAMGDWINASWAFRHWLDCLRRIRTRNRVVTHSRFQRAVKFAKKLLNFWNQVTKQLVLHRSMVFRCRLRLRRHAFRAWTRKAKLLVFASTVKKLSEAKSLIRICSSWRGRSVYIREVTAAIVQLGPAHMSSKTLFYHFDLWASEVSIRHLAFRLPRQQATWILRRSIISWAQRVRWSKFSRSKVHKKQKKRAIKYLFISFRSWRVQAVMQICQRSCHNSYVLQLATRLFSRWRCLTKEHGGKQRFINFRRRLFKEASPSLLITCHLAISQILSFTTRGSSEAPNVWPYAHDAMWSLFRTHILRFPYFASIQPNSTMNSTSCLYILNHDRANTLEVGSIVKDCSMQLLQARRSFFSVLVEMQQVYDPIACATSSVSQPRPLAGTAEKAAAALFCSHICVMVILKWRLIVRYNRVRRQRLEVALSFFAINLQDIAMKAWHRYTWASKQATRYRTVVLIARALRYQRKTLSALQAYAMNARILGSKFEIVRIANRTSVKRNAFHWWSHSKRRGQYLYQLHCNRHLREYVFEPFRLWSVAIKSHKRLLNVHCDLVSLTCARYAPHAAPSLRAAAIASASQNFQSTHAFWLDNPYIPFLRLCGITRIFSLWKEVCSVLHFLEAKASCVLHNRISSVIFVLRTKTLQLSSLKSNLSDFKLMVKIRILRSCLADWHQWKKHRLRAALSVNRSLGTESCRAILFWAMKFCSSPPIHFNWWTLYPKFRVYGTAAILSRTAKYIAYLRFARWQRAVVRGRSCSAQAAVLQQAQTFSFVCKHFYSWFQAHYAYRKGCQSIRLFYWKIFRSRILAQTRLRRLRRLVNARLMCSAIDYFALAIFVKGNVAMDSIPIRVASRVATSFLLPDNDCGVHAPMQKFILRRLLQGMMQSWLMLMLACKRRRSLDKRSYFCCWRFFVQSAQHYRQEAGRRHEQLQRLCSISQRVDKRLKCVTIRHLHALCNHRRDIFAAVASASSRFQVLHCVKTLRAVARRSLAVVLSLAKLRLRVACDFLRPVWRSWNHLLLENAHRRLWDRRESDAAFHIWLSNAADMKRRRLALEILQQRMLQSRKRYFFASWLGLAQISMSKQCAGVSFLKDRIALRLRRLFVSWRFSVFRLKWDYLLVSSCWRIWRGAGRRRNERVVALKYVHVRNLNKITSRVMESWRDWYVLRSQRRMMCQKITSKRLSLISSHFFSLWSLLTEQAISKMKEKCQDALIFRSEVLLRAFYMRWRHLRTQIFDCTQQVLMSVARHRTLRFFSIWSANSTAVIDRRLQKTACAALASRNAVISSFRLWRLFAFSHSHVKRHVVASDVASALAHSGRAMLSQMTVTQRARVMLLPRALQVAFVWFSQRSSRSFPPTSSTTTTSLTASSVVRGSRGDSWGGDSSSSGGGSSGGEERSPLSMSQLGASRVSIAARSRTQPSLDWHRPSFGAQTSFKIADVSSRNTETSSSQAPQARAAQLQQMLDELYGKSESP